MEGGFLPEPRQAQGGFLAEPACQRHQQPPAAQGQRQQAPPPRPGPAAAGAANEPLPEPRGGCSRCPCLSFNSEWFQAFGVVLCNQCRQQESLISKSTAKQRYSVGDSELSRLGSLRKSNPHKKDWQPMHLYLESQVAQLAHAKHCGAEGLLQYQQARLDAQLQAKIRKREEERRRGAAAEARLAAIRQRLEGEEAQRRLRQADADSTDQEEI